MCAPPRARGTRKSRYGFLLQINEVVVLSRVRRIHPIDISLKAKIIFGDATRAIPNMGFNLVDVKGVWLSLLGDRGSGYHQKDRKPSQNDKTGAGMEHDCAKSSQSSQKMTSQMSLWKKSAVKPEPELKNTIECNLYPSDGPGKPNSIFMKTVKTKMGPQSITTPFVVQIDKGHVRLKAQS
ncbi:hypothetical protein Tco_1282502 [Tanacetum coccineum]